MIYIFIQLPYSLMVSSDTQIPILVCLPGILRLHRGLHQQIARGQAGNTEEGLGARGLGTVDARLAKQFGRGIEELHDVN